MSLEIALRKYEDFMIDKSSFMLKGPSFVSQESEHANEEIKRKRDQQIKDAKEEDALAIVRYAVTDILGWTPEEALYGMNEEIMKQLRLDKIITYVQYPRDINKNKDYAWMIHRAFPKETSYCPKDQVLEMYKRLQNSNIDRFPKRVFVGNNGIEKLSVLLNDYISKNIPAFTISELYEYFSKFGEANKALRKAKLYYAYKDFYNTPLEYLHEALGENSDNFLYHHYQYLNTLTEMRKELKKQEKENTTTKVQSKDNSSKIKEPNKISLAAKTTKTEQKNVDAAAKKVDIVEINKKTSTKRKSINKEELKLNDNVVVEDKNNVNVEPRKVENTEINRDKKYDNLITMIKNLENSLSSSFNVISLLQKNVEKSTEAITTLNDTINTLKDENEDLNKKLLSLEELNSSISSFVESTLSAIGENFKKLNK